MNIISLFTVKGGVGKTTTCVNLAGEMSRRGYKTLIIDNDPQSNATQILNIKSIKYDAYDLYDNKNVTFSDCIYQYNKNLFIIPNNIESSELEIDLHTRLNRENILKNKLDGLSSFDFVLIDNSPFISIMLQNSLVCSNYCLTVIDNSSTSLKALNLVAKTINKIKENRLNVNLELLGILRNRFDNRTVFTKQFNEVAVEKLSDSLLKTIIPDSVKYKECSAMNMLMCDYNKEYNKPYENVLNEILGGLNLEKKL
jgi:chromosome partitioning protein